VRLGHREQVVVRRASGVDRTRLEHGADLAQGRAKPPVVAAADGGGARGRRVEADHHAHRGRFPGPVGTEEPGDDARPHLKGQVVDGELVAVALAEVLDVDHGHPMMGHRT
jgi:hypothetical protein